MEKKRPVTIRVERDQLRALKSLGIPIAVLVRDAIDKAVQTYTCPTCGTSICNTVGRGIEKETEKAWDLL